MGCKRLDWSDIRRTSQVHAAEQGQGGSSTTQKVNFDTDL